jgi:hypothetical protein
MSIIFRKNIKDVRLEQAVKSQENLPTENNKPRDTRYVKDEDKFFMWAGYSWKEIELVIG